ncbi:uncharacterized protein EV154DRAFT_566740 [Mucor mucedo]|uniref:uncharacterized protein n=1 Tax=Mucor mucedo TaxID=29922 RepID=UPI0022209B81|nr:uncharacterized protein EV154DRAFT_566740 [Mucor mucedo]KAI7888055.1 hypothetical protein EV154DRAFT_566740 [Mucor mucedo]
MEPSTNSSLYVATASFSARRGPRADTVAQEIAGLKTRIYALENPTVAAVSNVTKTGNDPEQCALIRQYYQDCITEKGLHGWDFTTTVMKGINLPIFQYILERFRLKEAEAFNPARPLHKMTLTKTKLVKTRIRRNFEGLKFADRKRRTHSVEELGELARKKNQAARLTAKFKRRKDNFLKYEADIVQKFHPKESCRAFLVKGYMSEDEDDQVNDQGQALSYTSLRPSWRSDQLNEMFDELDSPSGQRNVGRPLPRRIRQVPSLSVPFEQIGRLPSWGVRDGI